MLKTIHKKALPWYVHFVQLPTEALVSIIGLMVCALTLLPFFLQIESRFSLGEDFQWLALVGMVYVCSAWFRSHQKDLFLRSPKNLLHEKIGIELSYIGLTLITVALSITAMTNVGLIRNLSPYVAFQLEVVDEILRAVPVYLSFFIVVASLMIGLSIGFARVLKNRKEKQNGTYSWLVLIGFIVLAVIFTQDILDFISTNDAVIALSWLVIGVPLALTAKLLFKGTVLVKMLE